MLGFLLGRFGAMALTVARAWYVWDARHLTIGTGACHANVPVGNRQDR